MLDLWDQKLLFPNNSIQHCGIGLGIGGVAGHLNKGMSDKSKGYALRATCVHNISAVTGACMLVKKSIFDDVNGFDDVNLK